MSQFSHKLIVKDPFEMPAVDDITVLVLRECADLVPHCWIWNESVGYLEVVAYSGYDIYVTVKNTGMKENATSGTIFPSCMEFLITAPNATPIIDNTVTCLRADFKCPTVGQEALMSVDSTSAIRVGDIIIVDTRYQYLVTEIINEHTMKVLNEEKGKEDGVIDVKCNECVPVKILESTHCCEALQDQVDDIYNRIDTKKSIDTYVGSLVAITNGLNSLTDVANNVYIDVNPDLSYYDNTVSQFITLGDIPALPSDTDLSHYDNSTSGFITSSSLPTVNDATLTIYESDGVTPFVEFTANASSAVTATLPAMTTVNDATLTIYNSDGVTPFVTFTANAASNVTATLPSSPAPTINGIVIDTSISNEVSIDMDYAGITSHQAQTGYLGKTYPWDNIYVKTITGQNLVDTITYPSSNAADHDIIYDAGTMVLNHGHHKFNSGGITSLTIGHEFTTTGVDIFPALDNQYDLGNSEQKFAEAFIHELRTYNILPYPANTGTVGLSTNAFGTGHIDYFYTRELYPKPGLTTVRISDITIDYLRPYTGTSINLAASLIPATNNVYKLGKDSNNKFNDVWTTNINGSAYNPSDRDKKENITKRNKDTKGKKTSLEIVNSLDTYTYNYKDDKDKLLHIGIMAQDLESLEPDCVVDKGSENEKGEKDKDLYIDTFGFITILLEAVQELSAKVKDLESKLGEKDANNEVAQK